MTPTNGSTTGIPPALGALNSATERLNVALADRYRIERHLGAGGMATVYLAQDLKHDRKVAIKVLKPELAAVLGAERFVVEIKTTAALQHPHILPLFDSGSADGFLYYVMPYVEGETLRDKLNRETQLGVDESVRITREVADALDYAHRRGVIHRDIKPENILLHDGRPVVADFGIALAVSAAAGGRMTETGLSLGTPHYMSPEQATADKAITARSDLYSLGSVLYEMLAGEPPHTGSSAQQIIMKIIAEPVQAVTKYRKSVPANVAAAVGRALEKLPADRFETAKAFADALVTDGFHSSATTHVSAGIVGRPAGVPRWAFVSTAVIALAALGAAAWGWLRPAPAALVSRFNIVLPDSQTLAPNDNVARFTVSPNGRTIAYVGYDARRNGRWQIYLRHLDRLTSEPVAGTDDAISPSFSPDGKRIAFVSGTSRTLRVVSLTGGPPLVLTDSLVDLGGVAWGTDGYIYYDGHLAGDGLARIRENGGTPEIATRPGDPTESWHSGPRVLPNGRGVLFIITHDRGASPSDIGVLDTRTGKYRVLVRGMAPRYVAPGYLLYVTGGGTVMAARFDAERLTISGDPVPIVAGVAVSLRGAADLEPVPNGTLIYSAGSSADRSGELIRVTRDGQVSRIDSTWNANIRTLAFSPDGRSVAVTTPRNAGTEVWVKPLGTAPAVKIADAGSAPAWSPDGRTLAFSTTNSVLVGPSDGSALPRIRYPGMPQFSQLEYSPDGQWLVGTTSGDVVAFRTSGDSTLVPLVKSPSLERRGTLSPNGRWLAYESDESGRLEIYVRPFPDVQTAKRQISFASGAIPRWSHDGRELFYITERREIMSVPVSTSPTFSSGTPRLLFKPNSSGQPTSFDLERDGKHFVMLGRATGSVDTPDQIVVVEHFDRELSARFAR